MSADSRARRRFRFRPGLSTQVALGLVLGVAAGLFFGELIAPIRVIGDAFVGLLQMTVLPYVTVALIAGLGGMDYATARIVASRGGLLLVVLWVAPLLLVATFPLSFPEWPAASFFSTSLVEEPRAFDFVGLYIPSNPFRSLSQTLVPAVVLFAVFLGVALIGVPRKQALIDQLHTLEEALVRITGFVARLAPVGVFALTAALVGTTRLQELEPLQVYLIAFLLGAGLLTFWVIPGLVAALTPVGYREMISGLRDALVTAFATGSVLVVLPLIAQHTRALVARHASGSEEAGRTVEVVVPASFSFPHAGTILVLIFFPFSAWFVGLPLSAGEYPALLATGVFSLFAHSFTAVPFLLDLLRLPSDLFQLYVAVSVVTVRLQVTVGAMHVCALGVLVSLAVAGRLQLRALPLLRYLGITIALVLVTLGAGRVVTAYWVALESETYREFIEIEALWEPGPFRVRVTTGDEPPPAAGPRLRQIRERGQLRVCIERDALPFAFVNANGDLVGFDVDLAHSLARTLGVELELVRTSTLDYREMVQGPCDLAFSVAITPEAAHRVSLSHPYIEGALAFLMLDHHRHDYATWETMRDLGPIRIAIPRIDYYTDLIRERLAEAEIVEIERTSVFFLERKRDFDALAYTAEAGSAWTLVHPEFSVVVPQPNPIGVPIAIAMPRNDPELDDYINSWLTLKRSDGTLRQLHSHWIQGEGARRRSQPWSVMRNVLGWFD